MRRKPSSELVYCMDRSDELITKMVRGIEGRSRPHLTALPGRCQNPTYSPYCDVALQ